MKSNLSILGLYRFGNNLFDLLELPNDVDKQTVIDNILLECAEFEVIYSNWDMMRLAIGSWSKHMLPTWNQIRKSAYTDFNPLWNYDRTETDTETRNLVGTGNSENEVSAYNEDDFTNSNKNTSGTTETGTVEHQIRAFGNIGVTTSTQMLKEFREVEQFNFVDYLTEDFKKRFCLLVY